MVVPQRIPPGQLLLHGLEGLGAESPQFVEPAVQVNGTDQVEASGDNAKLGDLVVGQKTQDGQEGDFRQVQQVDLGGFARRLKKSQLFLNLPVCKGMQKIGLTLDLST